MHRWAEHAQIETLVELVNDRDAQMDDQDRYFAAAEELAHRVSTLLACVRHQDRRPTTSGTGRFLYTDEIRETLADRAV